MKISKSKQELARIISENGGWREEAESAAQCVGGEVSFWHDTATKQRGEDWCGIYLGACYDIRLIGVKLPNWHQTILSRDEYFYLYPATDEKPEFCESVMRLITEPEINSKNINIAQVDDINVVESKPTIEQLAAEYHNAKDYADRKQQEADAAKADADARLKALEIAAEDLGFKIEQITTNQDWL